MILSVCSLNFKEFSRSMANHCGNKYPLVQVVSGISSFGLLITYLIDAGKSKIANSSMHIYKHYTI